MLYHSVYNDLLAKELSVLLYIIKALKKKKINDTMTGSSTYNDP